MAEGASPGGGPGGAKGGGVFSVNPTRLDGTAELFGPAPQSVFEGARPADRLFNRCFTEQPVPDAKIEERLVRELRFDPDAWIIEGEDRSGRHFLDCVAA